MSDLPLKRPLRIDLPDEIRRVREVFREADFRGETVLQRLGKRAMTAFTPLEAAVVLHRTAEATALDLLVRLFVVGLPVPADEFAQAVASVPLETWVQLGLLQQNGPVVTASLRIMPYHELLLVCDAARASGAPVDPEYVMGAGTSTNTLAQLMPRRAARQSLDLGTGCGVLALVAAAHSERTWATDLNPRAVNYTAFNAFFNGRENIIPRTGSLFEPVDSEQFDLIVSNPPFVISPESRFIFRDGGEVGDELCRRIVGEVPQHLAAGGYCLLLCNWVHPRGEDGRQRLASWFRDSGCDAWILRSETSDTAKYAALWLSHTEGESAEDAATRFQGWLDYYERVGVEAISYGIIILRRRTSGPNWIQFDDAPAQFVGECGADVEACFRRQDFVQGLREPGQLLHEPLQLSPRVRLDQECLPGRSQPWEVVRARLRIEGGIAYSGELDAFVLSVLGACRGERPVGEIVAGFAPSMSLSVPEALQRALPLLRTLVERGFLLPTTEAGAR